MIKDMPVFDKVTPSLLEPMPYQYAGKNINVCIETEEFTCLCPWTGLPDYAYLIINYTPDKTVIELKSLKMYLQTYRMVGMVHESVVNSILNDLTKVVKPKNMTVELEFGVRGGITTTVSAEYKKTNNK
ncbi:MAG: preQ(1) synthase [Endomicrobia bacterium]|nr:preQ(1) synthase [Endomicrobiia bacterium]MCL2799622.1 preQ(1) synthase [Endomicrobiia bacterium]